MLTGGRERDHDHLSHSGIYDLPRGRSEAAEDFGVPLQPEDASKWDELMSSLVYGWLGWFTNLLLWIGGIVTTGLILLVAMLTMPPHPVEAAVLQASLFFAAFAVAALMFGGILAITAFLSWRERKAEGRRIYARLIHAMK